MKKTLTILVIFIASIAYSQNDYSVMYNSRFNQNEQISCKTKVELKDKGTSVIVTDYDTMNVVRMTRTSEFYKMKTEEGLSYRGAILVSDLTGTKYVIQIFEDEDYGIRFISQFETIQYLGRVW